MPASSRKWPEVKRLFAEAMRLKGTSRQLFVREATRGEPALRRELEELIAADRGADDFLLTPALGRRTSGKEAKAKTRLKQGEEIGDYTILKRLGGGSFGTVYLARQRSLGRDVALKVCPDMGREARTMAVLSHPNIVPVFAETREIDRGLRLIAMPYVAAVSLDRVLAAISDRGARPDGRAILEAVEELVPVKVPFQPEEFPLRERMLGLRHPHALTALGGQIAGALDYAHQEGVLHLDVKPENVLVTAYGRALLTDFNVARSTKGEDGAGELFGGTAEYMAPEHAEAFARLDPGAGNELDGRTDVYSLGVLLRKAIGTVPERRRGDDLRLVLGRAAEERRDRRYATAGELRRAIEGCTELSVIQERMREPGELSRLIRVSPITFLGALGLLPPLLMLTVNVGFSQLLLVSLLTPAESTAFHELLFFWSPLGCAAGVAAWLLWLGRFRTPLARPEKLFHSSTFRRKWRRRLLRFPFAALASATLSLLPTILYGAFHQFDPATVERRIFLGYALPQLPLWLGGVAFFFLYLQVTLLRSIYPLFLSGEPEATRVAVRELRNGPKQLWIFHVACVVIPLALAIAALCALYRDVDIITWRACLFVVGVALVLATLGFLLADTAIRRLHETLATFLRPEPAREA